MSRKQLALFEPTLVVQALKEAVKKLNPQAQWRNPVMFIVWIGSLLTTCISIAMASGAMPGNALFSAAISGWLWVTVLFANFAEALAEGRSKAQANSLKGVKKTAFARKLREPKYGAAADKVPADQLRKGDIVLVEAGDIIPCDGEVIEGGASVDESAITGESAPVIRESGGDFASVTGGTRILSDWLVIECSVNPGETFLDRMIAMVEGAQRRKTPNEIALTILLIALTIVFLLATATLWPFSAWGGNAVSVTVLVALLVCLIPTTIGGLLSAIGVAGMSRMLGANVIATSGRAVEAAGDVDVLLLDKTGTITLGNRQASEFIPAQGVDEKTLADAAQLASLADETPEGRSIVILAKQRFNLRERDVQSLHATFVPFTAQSRMSGINIDNRMIRKGSVDAIRRHVEANGGHFPADVDQKVDQVARQGATPLVVVEGSRVLGVISLKDIVKGGIKERFAQLRKMGIKTVMITGDNRLTAAAIAAEAGVDDFLAEATPEAKLALIRQYQAEGRLVAMTGDGTNDAPALAQADIAVAMNSGTQAAKEARPFRLAVIQLGTYDGTIYNARQVVDKIGHLCDYILFDSAWVGYEQFIPMMADCSPLLLDLNENDPGILVTQSVHKQQAGFSQTSQIHKKDSHIKGQQRYVPHKRMNNAFMMHASTSPFYPLFAALDINAKMHEGVSGRNMWMDCVVNGINARKLILDNCQHIRPFVPELVDGKPWQSYETAQIAVDLRFFQFVPGEHWHSFEGYAENQYFVDPCKLLLTTPGFDARNGEYEAFGVPATILANFLRENGVVPEKCDLNSILFLLTPAEDMAKLQQLVALLVRFEKLLESDAPLAEVLPSIYKQHEERYAGYTLRQLCQEMHDLYARHNVKQPQKEMFRKEHFPRVSMNPQEANYAYSRGEVELVRLPDAEGRIAAEGALPYPPGVLCVVPGEIWGGAVLRYFSALEEGINLLPGFAPELQGVYIEEHDGRKQVWCYVIKPRDAQSTLLKGEKL